MIPATELVSLMWEFFVCHQKGDTALHSAAMMGRFNVVKLLLDKGADANLLSNVSKKSQIYCM